MEPGAATYPAIAVEDERSFLVRVMGWMFAGLSREAIRRYGRER